MGVVVLHPAGGINLTTVAHAKASLGIEADDACYDDQLADLIARASSVIATECRRVFGAEQVTETLDGSGSRLLALSRRPLARVYEVLEDSEEITDWSLEHRESAVLYRSSGWRKAGGSRMWGVEAFASGYILPGVGASQRFSVTYTAGYTLPGDQNPYLLDGPTDIPNLPGAVEQACLETIRTWRQEIGTDPTISSVRVDDVSVTYGTGSSRAGQATAEQAFTFALSDRVLGLLRPFRLSYR